MFKINVEENKSCWGSNAADMKQCQIAEIIEEGEYTGQIIMRNQSREQIEFINLSSPVPGKCWSRISPQLKVRLLPPGTKITLTIGDGNV